MERKDRDSSGINNGFYDTLGTDWQDATAHPIALLRAENALRNPWIATVIEEKFSGSSAVLDIGCGAGFLTNYLAQKGHQVSGIDLSEKSLEVAKKNDQTANVAYAQASAYALPYPDQNFDVVSAMDLLEHVEHPEKVISEAGRVLKKGGLFFFHTFSRNFLSWLVVIKGVEWAVRNTPSNMHVLPLFINPSEMEAMCRGYQLEVKQFKGCRPECSKAFWKMLFTRKVPADLHFTFTNSLTTGYSGYAVKS